MSLITGCGSWNNNPVNCRSANRNNNEPGNLNNNVGFRVALLAASTLGVPESAGGNLSSVPNKSPKRVPVKSVTACKNKTESGSLVGTPKSYLALPCRLKQINEDISIGNNR
ncbi:MAG: hypothetical protein F6K03_12200 [Kamptonema sp. SIO4C4]|nr:hypothetical protein [Kamptonema sp. SIO4C4]